MIYRAACIGAAGATTLFMPMADGRAYLKTIANLLYCGNNARASAPMSPPDFKDYLTVREAAAYCGVSYSHFRAHITDAGVVAGNLWGKLVYRRQDLKQMVERLAWRQSIGAEQQRILIGEKLAFAGDNHLVISHHTMPRRRGRPRRLNSAPDTDSLATG